MERYFTSMMVYSSFIKPEVIVDLKRDSYRAILHQFNLHQLLITCSIKPTNIVVPSPKLPCALLFHTLQFLAFIGEALFIHQTKVFSILANEIWETFKKNNNKKKNLKTEIN